MGERVVILGAGHAGGQAAISLRQAGWDGDILILGEEPYPPYQRPPLSKDYLAGKLEMARLFLRPQSFYETKAIACRSGCRVEAIDRDRKSLRLADGEALGYDKLILATGTRPRRLKVPGADLPNIFCLRTIEDVHAIQPRFESGERIAIVGAGYIGLEVAAVAAKRGMKVHVIEAAERVLARVSSPLVADFYADVHRNAGVDIRLSASLTAFEGHNKVERLVLADGGRLDADLVIVGIGVVPNQELAAEAGLKCDNGIWVDDCARTEDAAIFAAGDCANHFNALAGRRLRLESVQNAVEQAKAAALAICGKPQPWQGVPSFWSDQYDLKLLTNGIIEGYDDIVLRGNMDQRKFAAFYMKDGRMIASDCVNAPADHMGARNLIASQKVLPTDELGNPAIPLKEILASAA
ncbi:MAG: pyridine nucleotide-disulfide oxidoreductase [Alphaproteobacteria bacterium]|nr:MAG: pyridine nucleotide-disulfide oxidoreductase [Alphaproteobacteria bacterium]